MIVHDFKNVDSIYSKRILAGNFRFDLQDNKKINIEPQMQAFKAGLTLAADMRDITGKLPLVSVAVDHKGVFRKNFLRYGLTNSQKRHPKISDLKDEAIDFFSRQCNEFKINPEEILIIHEDSARTHLSHIIETENIPPDVYGRIAVLSDMSNIDLHGEDSTKNIKVTCAAVTSEYFRKAVGATDPENSDILLEVFFEDTPWSNVLTYVRGLQITHALGIKINVRLNLVDHAGTVFPGEITSWK